LDVGVDFPNTGKSISQPARGNQKEPIEMSMSSKKLLALNAIASNTLISSGGLSPSAPRREAYRLGFFCFLMDFYESVKKIALF
jgi:hypothetical protein